MLHVKIITPNHIVFEGEARSLTLPAYNGEMQVLPGHSKYAALLTPGTVMIDAAVALQRITLENTGLLRVSHDQVTVLVD